MCVGPAGRHEGTPGVASLSVGLPWTVCDRLMPEEGVLRLACAGPYELQDGARMAGPQPEERQLLWRPNPSSAPSMLPQYVEAVGQEKENTMLAFLSGSDQAVPTPNMEEAGAPLYSSVSLTEPKVSLSLK